MLSNEDIAEYQALVKARHGIEISKADALEDALSLINFMRLCVNRVAKNQSTTNNR